MSGRGSMFGMYGRARLSRASRVLVAVTMAATSGAMLASSGAAAAAATGGLVYPPALLQSLPDDSATGDGVTAGSVGCPTGHPHPVGGGVNIDGTDPGLDLEVKSTGPAGNAWRVQGNNNSGSDAQMTVYAICATGDYVYPHKSITIGAGQTGAAKISCPAGRKVTGGGVTTIGGNHSTEVTSSEPADGPDSNTKIDDAWFGQVGNGSGSSVTMKVQAVCAKGGTYVYKVGTRTTLLDGGVVTSVVLCPNGSRVTGGGLDIDGANTDLEMHESFPIDGSDADGLPDDGWQSTAYNDGSGTNQHMKTYAICKKV